MVDAHCSRRKHHPVVVRRPDSGGYLGKSPNDVRFGDSGIDGHGPIGTDTNDPRHPVAFSSLAIGVNARDPRAAPLVRHHRPRIVSRRTPECALPQNPPVRIQPNQPEHRIGLPQTRRGNGQNSAPTGLDGPHRALVPFLCPCPDRPEWYSVSIELGDPRVAIHAPGDHHPAIVGHAHTRDLEPHP